MRQFAVQSASEICEQFVGGTSFPCGLCRRVRRCHDFTTPQLLLGPQVAEHGSLWGKEGGEGNKKMKLTKEQKFLYTRIAILVASAGWIASAFAGLKGFPFWYGGFVVFFWIAFGFINYQQKTSLWLLVHKRIPFLLFYAALAASLFILNQFGLHFELWFYPLYRGWWFLFVYLVLYPCAGLAVLELIYALTRLFGERLSFIDRPKTMAHDAIDAGEGLLFLAMWGFLAFGAAGVADSLGVFPYLTAGWFLFAAIKLAFHIRHWNHYVLILVLTGVIAALLHEVPHTVAFEWVHLTAPILNTLIFGIPLWAVVGWYWFTLFTLRLWIFLVLHPKVK